jgi:hypothetical protein
MLPRADNLLALPLTCTALLALFVGCGSTTRDAPAQDASVGGTAGGGAGSSGETNTGGSNAAGGGSASGGTASDEAIASITVFSPRFLGAPYVRLTPSFQLLEPNSVEPCPPTTYGPCLVYECLDQLRGLATQDAGTITLESSPSGVRVVTSPDADGLYVETENSGGTLAAGETLNVSASGGEIGPFEATLDFPTLLVVEQPAPNAPGAIPVSRSSPVQLAWTGGARDVFLFANASTAQAASAPSVVLGCTFDSESGTATIPAEALANLESGTVVGFYTLAKRTVQAGSDSVAIWAGAEALTPNTSAAVELLLQ